jgi:hypothetical protein
MQSHIDADGRLIVTYSSTGLRKVIVSGAVVFAATAVYDLTIGTRGTDRLVALMGAIGVCLGAGLVLLEESHFVFDPKARTVNWRRRWAWSRSEGHLAFADIQHVTVQTMGESRTYPDRRVCLQLASGALLPLTRGYAPDAGGECSAVGDEIRRVLGAADAASDDALAALVRSGHKMDAIRILRERGLSLEDAKRRVDTF